MFKKILFATSATSACDHAARVAFDMAQRYNAHIDVFHVLGIPSRGFSQVVVDVTTGDEVLLDDNYRDLVKEEIRTYYDLQIKKTENWSIDVAIGLPHREILRIARHIKPDIIVMGGNNGASGSYAEKKIVTGSTFQRVAKAARCPVMVINRPAASFWGGFSNVVFATDFSDAADIAFDDVLIELNHGNEALENVYRKAGMILGVGIYNLMTLLNPELVIITGKGVQAGEPLFSHMFDSIEQLKGAKFGFDQTEIVIKNWTDEDWARESGSLVLREIYKSPFYI